jgi:hypothetical protein
VVFRDHVVQVFREDADFKGKSELPEIRDMLEPPDRLVTKAHAASKASVAFKEIKDSLGLLVRLGQRVRDLLDLKVHKASKG